jgi:Protein kinase domain
VRTQTEVGIGTDFVGYRIEARIGRGGMGVVYRAYDLRLKRTVALKLVTPELALDQRFRERFARETELAMALEHPNVVPVHDAGDVDGRLYLAMRLVEGTDLRTLLHREGSLAPPRAFAICRQIANALDAAHAKGLVHRDVKPSNVLLDDNEHVYLADFGLTRRLEDEGPQAAEHRSLGTPAYLAPEQIEHGPVDGRADVYSLGCLLHECLTGEAPFPRGSRLAVAWAHLEEEPPRATALNPELPEGIDAVIRKGMAKDRDDRYAMCAALVAAAEDALGVRQRPLFPRRQRVLLAAAVIVVGLAAAVAAVLATLGRGREPSPPVVHENTVVRIDPKTNAVTRVVDVGRKPMVAAVGGHSVWVYNEVDNSLSEIDAGTGKRRQTTALSATPVDLGFLTGPVLAADAAGAWVIGVDGRGKGVLTGVPSGRTDTHEYRLGVDPRAVAATEGAVWVLGRGRHENYLLRIAPESGRRTGLIRFSGSSAVGSLALGLGAVWVMASSTATLYRIDPRSARVVAQADFGARAGRVSFNSGSVWVHVSDAGGMTLLVDPRTLEVTRSLDCCPLGEGGAEAAGFGSAWTNDPSTGTTVRWNAQTYNVAHNFRLTDPPFFGGPCLTSIAAGAGGVWVTVAPAIDWACKR